MWNIFVAYYLKVFPENKSWFLKGFYLVAVSALKDVHRIHCFEGHLGVTKLILNSFYSGFSARPKWSFVAIEPSTRKHGNISGYIDWEKVIKEEKKNEIWRNFWS